MTTQVLANPPTQVSQCPVCGATGDLAPETRYLGGHGNVTDLICRDRVACWGRLRAQQLVDQIDPSTTKAQTRSKSTFGSGTIPAR